MTRENPHDLSLHSVSHLPLFNEHHPLRLPIRTGFQTVEVDPRGYNPSRHITTSPNDFISALTGDLVVYQHIHQTTGHVVHGQPDGGLAWQIKRYRRLGVEGVRGIGQQNGIISLRRNRHGSVTKLGDEDVPRARTGQRPAAPIRARRTRGVNPMLSKT